MNALINPLAQAMQIVSWGGKNTKDDPIHPNLEPIPNSAVICEVREQTFEVAPPLYWINCADVTAHRSYLDTLDNQIKEVVDVPVSEFQASEPAIGMDQPTTQGTQTL